MGKREILEQEGLFRASRLPLGALPGLPRALRLPLGVSEVSETRESPSFWGETRLGDYQNLPKSTRKRVFRADLSLERHDLLSPCGCGAL